MPTNHEPRVDRLVGLRDVEEVDVLLVQLGDRVFQVGLAVLPGLVLEGVPDLGRREQVPAPDVEQDQVQGGQPLLTVDQLPAAVRHPLHHHGLQVVAGVVAGFDVVQQVGDLSRPPAVAPLVGADVELAGDLAHAQVRQAHVGGIGRGHVLQGSGKGWHFGGVQPHPR